MKKIILSILVLLIISSSSSFVFAKGKSKGAGRQNKQSREVRNKNIAQEKRGTARKDLEKGKSKVEIEKQRLLRTGKGETKKEETKTGKGKTKSEILEKGAAKGKAAENIGKGKGQQQQIKAFEKQMLHEESKYLKRQAHFKRIRELAMKKGNTTVLERLKILEEKEQSRYGQKRKRIMERMQQLKTGEGEKLRETLERNTVKGRGRTKTEAEKVKEKLDSKTEKAKELTEKEEE